MHWKHFGLHTAAFSIVWSRYLLFWIPAISLKQSLSSIFRIDQLRRLVTRNSKNHRAVSLQQNWKTAWYLSYDYIAFYWRATPFFEKNQKNYCTRPLRILTMPLSVDALWNMRGKMLGCVFIIKGRDNALSLCDIRLSLKSPMQKKKFPNFWPQGKVKYYCLFGYNAV